jgi:hypothetical protein
VAVFAVVAKAWFLAALVLALSYPPPAAGHDPCGPCLSPSSGPPGTKVTITQTTAYWVVWNGRGLPQDALLRSHYRPMAQTIDLVRYALPPASTAAPDPDVLPAARRNVRFTVPAVREGTYAVVIYDGSEGGEHYTWDLFRVRAGEGSANWPAVAGAAAAAAALFLVAYGARRVLRQPSES